MCSSDLTVADRAYFLSTDRTDMVRVGGGNAVDDVGSSDIPDRKSVV